MLTKRDIKLKELSVNELCTMLRVIVAINEVDIKELSESSGCAYSYLISLLNGKIVNPTYKTLNNISAELGYTLQFNLTKKVIN